MRQPVSLWIFLVLSKSSIAVAGSCWPDSAGMLSMSSSTIYTTRGDISTDPRLFIGLMVIGTRYLSAGRFLFMHLNMYYCIPNLTFLASPDNPLVQMSGVSLIIPISRPCPPPSLQSWSHGSGSWSREGQVFCCSFLGVLVCRIRCRIIHCSPYVPLVYRC